NRHMVLLYSALFFVANSLHMFEPLIIAKVLNIIQEQGVTSANLSTILWYLSLFIFLYLGFWAFHGPARVIERKNAFLCRANYKKHLVDGTLGLSPEWHTDHHSGDTIDKIEKGTRGMFEYSGHVFEVISAVIKLIGSYFALAYFNLHSAYIVAFLGIVCISTILTFDKYLLRQYKELNRAENRISEKIYDIISNITTVIILRIERLVSSSIYKRVIAPLKLFVRNNKLNETKWFTVSCFSSTMMFLVIGSYIYFNFTKGNVILVGTIAALYGYVNKISQTLFHFAYRYGDIVKWRAQVSNAEEISDNFKKKKKTVPVKIKKWKDLRIENLKFSYYTASEHLHLDNISLDIMRGQRIALIGDSGSGKTTFMRIIRELYHPKHLKMYLDGKQIKKGFKAISNEIALIPQDPEIFSTTIKENITLGIYRPMKEIKYFTDMARFTEVANRLPRKWNSSIVEKGVNLSGGEKQRLALARGLMAGKNKSILLLDEPTSSVDLKNELKIFHNIFNKFKDKTIIASVHRLHLLMLFNKIYYFKNGKIIAEGNFWELLDKSKDFRNIWEKYQKAKRLDMDSY
ncbi:ABC transporter ATP-binding protein/permease, partial [Candidatus Woesearchaeota archaeon]|nr:ABC transporter ATP-binding protein/permease [Candidatus Woesearchaeota archaeon]